MKKYIEACRSLYDRGKIIEKPPEKDLDLYNCEYIGPMYYSVFDHTEDLIEYYNSHTKVGTDGKLYNTVEDYDGPVSCNYVPFDFDGPDAITDIWKTVLACGSSDKYIIDDFSIYFSGNKGFHLLLKTNLYKTPHKDIVKEIKSGVRVLKKRLNLKTLDESIYKKTGIIRAPNSRHEKTKLFKIPLFAAELHLKSLETIRDLALFKRDITSEPAIKDWLKSRGWYV